MNIWNATDHLEYCQTRHGFSLPYARDLYAEYDEIRPTDPPNTNTNKCCRGSHFQNVYVLKLRPMLDRIFNEASRSRVIPVFSVIYRYRTSSF